MTAFPTTCLPSPHLCLVAAITLLLSTSTPANAQSPEPNLSRNLTEQEKRINTLREKISDLTTSLDTATQPPSTTQDTPIAPAIPDTPTQTTYTTHVVSQGDNMASIAARHGLTADKLALFNQIDNPNKIIPGQILKIPSPDDSQPLPSDLTAEITPPPTPPDPPTPPTPPTTTDRPSTHRVNPGETYTAIARITGFTVNEIENANPGVDPNRLLVGQVINLPGTHTTTPTTESTSQPATPTPITTTDHIVRPGENITTIARNFNTTNEVILALNSINDPSTIRAGQTLKVPVFDEETIENARLAAEQAAIQAAINAEQARENAKQAALPTPPNDTRQTHTVTPGQSLYVIAQQFDVSIDAIKEWNELTNDTIYVDQVLFVSPPQPEPPPREAIEEEPQPDPHANPPQVLYEFPAGPHLPPAITLPLDEFAPYNVRDGDSLQSIARRYFLSIRELADMNHLPTDAKLNTGQLLVLPMHALYSLSASDEPNPTPPPTNTETAATSQH